MGKERFRFNDLLTPANILSLSRIPIAAVMILLYQHKVLFLVLLTVAIITDLLDGYVARATRPTALGAFLDPLCDKIFFAALLIFLVFASNFTVWHLLILLLRDIFMVVLMIALVFHPKRGLFRQKVKARWFGKMTTVGQFVALLWLFLGLGLFNYLLYAVALVSLVAIADYVIVFRKWLAEHG